MGRCIAVLLAAVLAGCSSGDPRAAPTETREQSAAQDVRVLLEHVEAVHPNPWHAVTRSQFERAAARLELRVAGLSPDEQLVGLMRLTALLETGDGHSGIFPLDATHDRALHLYPVRLYDFSDGLFVVDSIGHPALVGARIIRIAGRPVAEVAAAVLPLVPADNEWSRRARLAQYMVVGEVLHGLGLRGTELDLELPGGERQQLDVEPVSTEEYAAEFSDLFHPMVPQGLPVRPRPPYLAHRLDDAFVTRLEGGRAVYVAYNVTLGDTTGLADEILRMTRHPKVERLILDVRHNPGGDNGTYPPLLDALSSAPVEPLYVLIGRTTFSAAGNLIAELDRRRDVVFVGEPSGAAPNLYGDPVPVALPATGLTAHIASVYWEKSEPGNRRDAIEPDVPVELSSGDYFTGRDPVLQAALAD
jgi:hypothetical protein